MKKIGILTFHYSNNYGGVLQTIALYNTLSEMGCDVEVINYVPKNYKPKSSIYSLKVIKNILIDRKINFELFNITKKNKIMKKYRYKIINEFDTFRKKYLKMTQQVDDNSIYSILNDYSVIIVGSDQIWNPSQRKSPIYFLDFDDNYSNKKVSYAADSTVSEVSKVDFNNLKQSLSKFDYISVRNDHSYEFIKNILNTESMIVADPTLLCNFEYKETLAENRNEYILTYILGKEINGSNKKAIEMIKRKYGNLPVYSIKIPTMDFELSEFADKTFYDLNPEQWINLFKNAKFIFTDSFHGVLFSLKYHKPFIAYYSEKIRSTRFVDLAKRYKIERYIVRNITEIEKNKSLELLPDFCKTDIIIKYQVEVSIKFLKNALDSELNSTYVS